MALLALGITARGQPPSLEAPAIDASGAVTITVHGVPGTNYAVEYSGDLRSWWPQVSALATNAVTQFQYVPAAGSSARYFRARVDVPLPPITVAYHADTNSLDVALVTPEEGGTLSLTDTNGVTYTLTVPTNAVSEPQVFELTLITNITGLPFNGSTLGGVSLDPAGLVLAENAQLEISFPTNQPIDPLRVAGYTFEDDGSFLRLNAVAVETNSVTMPVFTLAEFGCSYATLAELDDLRRRPVGDTNTALEVLLSARLKGTHQPRSVYGPSLLDQCYPAELARAKSIDHTLETQLNQLNENLAANAGKILSEKPELGGLINNWGPGHLFFWDGNQDELYSSFYDLNIVRYFNEAHQNCAITEVLARRIRELKGMATWFGGTVLAAKNAGIDLCPGFTHCFTEIEDCCQSQGIGGPAARFEARRIATEEAYDYDCALPDPDQVARDCQPTWSGTISVVQLLTSKTNTTDGTISTFDNYTELDTVVYTSDKSGLTGQATGLGFYGLSGKLIASGACSFDEVTVTVDSSCCGSCTTTTHSRSACAPKGTAQGGFAWQLTNSPPPPVPIPLTMSIVPDAGLILATHGVKRPVHTSWTLSYRESDPKGNPQCVSKGGQNNFTGSYDFSGIPFFNFQNTQQGTVSSFSGSYVTNIVHSDGVTTTRIQASWNFERQL